MSFPTVRMRRLRRTAAFRDILNQMSLHPSQLIYADADLIITHIAKNIKSWLNQP